MASPWKKKTLFTNKNQELFETLLSRFQLQHQEAEESERSGNKQCLQTTAPAGPGQPTTKETCCRVPVPQRHGGRAVREHPLEEVYLQQGLEGSEMEDVLRGLEQQP